MVGRGVRLGRIVGLTVGLGLVGRRVGLAVGFGWGAVLGFGADGFGCVGLMTVGLLIVGLFIVGLLTVGLFTVGLLAVGLLTVGLLMVGLFTVGLLIVGLVTVGLLAVGLDAAWPGATTGFEPFATSVRVHSFVPPFFLHKLLPQQSLFFWHSLSRFLHGMQMGLLLLCVSMHTSDPQHFPLIEAPLQLLYIGKHKGRADGLCEGSDDGASDGKDEG